MIKTLTNVGNSKALIIPKKLLTKYKLTKVILQETKDGILIKPAGENIEFTFQDKLEQLKKKKKEIYARMNAQANDPDTIAYYNQNDLSDIDIDIIEE